MNRLSLGYEVRLVLWLFVAATIGGLLVTALLGDDGISLLGWSGNRDLNAFSGVGQITGAVLGFAAAVAGAIVAIRLAQAAIATSEQQIKLEMRKVLDDEVKEIKQTFMDLDEAIGRVRSAYRIMLLELVRASTDIEHVPTEATYEAKAKHVHAQKPEIVNDLTQKFDKLITIIGRMATNDHTLLLLDEGSKSTASRAVPPLLAFMSALKEKISASSSFLSKHDDDNSYDVEYNSIRSLENLKKISDVITVQKHDFSEIANRLQDQWDVVQETARASSKGRDEFAMKVLVRAAKLLDDYYYWDKFAAKLDVEGIPERAQIPESDVFEHNWLSSLCFIIDDARTECVTWRQDPDSEDFMELRCFEFSSFAFYMLQFQLCLPHKGSIEKWVSAFFEGLLSTSYTRSSSVLRRNSADAQASVRSIEAAIGRNTVRLQRVVRTILEAEANTLPPTKYFALSANLPIAPDVLNFIGSYGELKKVGRDTGKREARALERMMKKKT